MHHTQRGSNMKKHILLSFLLLSTTAAYASDAKVYPAPPEPTPTTATAPTFTPFTSEIATAKVSEIPLPYRPSHLVSNCDGLGGNYSLHTSKELSEPFRLMLNKTTQQFYAVQQHSDSDLVFCTEITDKGALSATTEERTSEYVKENLANRDNRNMYHFMERALKLIIKPAITSHPDYDFYIKIADQKYKLTINSDQYIIATSIPEARACFLARLFLIHWDRLTDSIEFYGTPSDPFSEDKRISKRAELRAALINK